MRSFLIALIFLLMICYWSHLLVTRTMNSNESFPIIMDNTISGSGICECRCCLLSSTICESTIRHSISFKKEFSCHLCTNDFCMKNMSQLNQCYSIYSTKAECFQYENRRDSPSSFISTRPILQ